MGSKKTGVLIINLGTPDSPTRGAVYRYLKQFLLDPRVIDYSWLPRNLLVRGLIAPFRSGSSAKLYREVWTDEGSPIKYFGEELVKGVRELLPKNYMVELAMRYQNPSIYSALNKMSKQLVEKLVIFPLFPQYASATTGSIHAEVMRIVSDWEVIPEISFVNSYPEDPIMISIFAENARQYEINSYDHILFSYHGLPQRQLKKADITDNHCLIKNNCCETRCAANQFCYSAQCYQTSSAIADHLGIVRDDYTVCFQSRLGPEKWAQPYTSEVIENLLKQGNKKLLVFSPAFVADCLETTIEIGVEYKEEFIEKGGETLDLVPSLNNNPTWIKRVAQLVSEK